MTTQRGLISSVSTTPLGTVLTSDAAAGETVLAVDWTAEFDPAGGQLLLGETPLVYMSATDADEDLSTIVLRDPLAADVVAGESVTSLTVAGEPRLAVEVYVAFDEGEEPVAYSVDSALQGRITEDTPTGTPVKVDLSMGRIVGRDNTPAQLDGSAVWNPYLSRRGLVQTLQNVTWVPATEWTDEVSQGLILEPDGSVTIVWPGFYVIDASPTYAASSSGARSARILVNGVQFGYASIPAEAVGTTDVPVGVRRPLVEGDNVRLDYRNGSGATLDTVEGPGSSPFSMYRVSL